MIAITRADAILVLQMKYNLQQQGSNSTPEEYFWGSLSDTGGPIPPSPVPEPSSLLLVGGSLFGAALLKVR